MNGKHKPKHSLNARQERFCQLFVAHGVISQAFIGAGYKPSEKALLTTPYRMFGSVRVKARIAELQAQKDARLAKKAITKENLVEKFWEFVHDPQAKRGEATQAGIAIAKMVGWNAPTRVEHDLGDRVRAYLEDIRSRPLRPTLHASAQVIELDDDAQAHSP